MKVEQIERYIKEQKEELQSSGCDFVRVEFLKDSIQQLQRLKYKVENNIQTSDVKGILQKLKNLDLAKNPYDDALKLIQQLGQVPVIVKFLYPENNLQDADSFIRARPLKRNEKRPTAPDELSFKPQKYNTTYQRASTPNKTVFYGCLKKFDGIELQPDNRLVATMETLRMILDKSVVPTKKRIAYGKWIVTETMNVVSIINRFHNNPHIKKMFDESQNWSDKFGVEDDTQLISDFFAEQFANEEAGTGNEHLYMLSAMWAEACMSKPNIDGVLYPSVRSAGDGICVAIKPESCNKMSLVVAGESPVYKNKEQVIIDNEYVCEIPIGASSYEMKFVDEQYNQGEEYCLRQIGISSPNELIFE